MVASHQDSAPIRGERMARNAETEASPSATPDSDGFHLEAAVEAGMHTGFRRLRFAPRLEQLFEEETGTERSRQIVRTTLPALLVYIFFLLADYQLARATFGQALVIRLGVVTPAVVLAMLAIHRGVPPLAREWLGAGALTLVGLSVVYLFGLGDDPGVIPYDSGLILVLAFMAIVARIRFWYMVGATVTLIAAYIGMTTLRFGPADAVLQHNTSVLIAGAIFMLAANFFLEREYRRAYLYRVQNRLHVAALRESNDKLRVLSHLDALTGIANRRSFDELLADLCRQADQEPFGIVMLDIDFFKNFNDLYGHPVGDDCIRRVAGILRASMRRSGDRVARFGGEEFVALLPGTELKESIDVAERMRRGVRDLGMPHGSSRIAPVVTISAGVLWVSSQADPAGILARTDAALYQAKRQGRDRVCVGQPADAVAGTDKRQ